MRGNQKSGCQLLSARNPWTFMAEATFILAAFCICEAGACKLQKFKKMFFMKKYMYQLLNFAMSDQILIVDYLFLCR